MGADETSKHEVFVDLRFNGVLKHGMKVISTYVLWIMKTRTYMTDSSSQKIPPNRQE